MRERSEAALPVGSLVISEIAHQPYLWPTTLERISKAGIPAGLRDLPAVLTGAGTSAYAAAAVAEAWPGARAIATTDLLPMSAAEIKSALPLLAAGGLLVSLARSGDSPESVAVVERIKKFFPQVQHLAIVCNAEGRLARMPGVHAISLDPGTNDQSLAMTSSFSNLVLGGLCLSQSKVLAEHLPALCTQVSNQLPEWNQLARDIAGGCGNRIVILSSAMHAFVDETALKIVELTAGRVVSMPQTFLGLRHGPMSFLREDTAVLCFLSSDAEKRRYEEDLIKELRKRRLGRLIVVGDAAAAEGEHDWFVPAGASHLPDSLRTPFEIPFSQLLAFHLSVKAGIDPDNPSPDGVVTRVVTQFRIHEDRRGA